MKEYTDIENLIDTALGKYPKARRMAVENFCFSAPNDKIANDLNIIEDARMYEWNSDTTNAIRLVLKTQKKL